MRTRTRFREWSLTLSAALGLGCGAVVSSEESAGGGQSDGASADRGGTNPFPCDNPRPQPHPNGFSTSVDTCADGSSVRARTLTCSRGCRSDAECSPGHVCVCNVEGGVASCWAGTCHSGEDCAPGFDCRMFSDVDPLSCYGFRLECQRPGDECGSDADCGPDGGRCRAGGATGIHRCEAVACTIPGRPFLVDGRLRVAPLECRADWAARREGPLEDEPARDSEQRERLAAHYVAAGLLEHASIAAFARFALQLLALGAPRDLVEGAQLAMADEIEHARLCFGLAWRFGGSAAGPGPLDVGAGLGRLDLETVTRLVVREGCIGETLAAVEAGEAYAHARDGAVRDVLARIVRDEARHAELAFRFVAWAIARRPGLGRTVLAELEADVAVRRAALQVTPCDAGDAGLPAFGVLPPSHAARVAACAADEVVVPLLREIVRVAAREPAAEVASLGAPGGDP